MRLLICAGGTGGGVNPALAVLSALMSEQADLQTLWVGAEGGMESWLVERARIPYKAIPASGIHGVGLRALPGNLSRLLRGVFASRRILREFKPDVLFFTGGYVAVPMAVAGRKIPSVLYVPDIEPGLALNTLTRFASRVAVTCEESFRFFKHTERLVLTGYPVRPNLTNWTRTDARKALHLSDGLPVLLIVGGSKGARAINQPVQANLPELLGMAQILHLTGEADWPVVEAAAKGLPKALANRYHPYAYLHEEMGAALAAADLALSRSGASTLGEYPLFGLPAILVPYPYAWRYQKVNAEYLVRHGAAVMIENEQLSDQLLPTVKDLLGNPSKLTIMRDAMRRLSYPHAAADIGHILLAQAEKRS